MTKIIDYNLTTVDETLRSLSEYSGISKDKIHQYILATKDDYNGEEFIDLINFTDEKLLSDKIKMTALHVTTNNDRCSAIKKYGLINLQKAITFDTPLNNYLRRKEIKISLDQKEVNYMGKNYVIKNYSKGYLTYTPAKKVYRKFFEDYSINSFFFHDNVLNYGGHVNHRPEIIYDLAELLQDHSIVSDWVENNECYVIEFKAPFDDFEYSHSIQMQEINEKSKKLESRKWLIEKSLSIINSYFIHHTSSRELPCELKPDTHIAYKDIQKIYSANEYLEEYGIYSS